MNICAERLYRFQAYDPDREHEFPNINFIDVMRNIAQCTVPGPLQGGERPAETNEEQALLTKFDKDMNRANIEQLDLVRMHLRSLSEPKLFTNTFFL